MDAPHMFVPTAMPQPPVAPDLEPKQQPHSAYASDVASCSNSAHASLAQSAGAASPQVSLDAAPSPAAASREPSAPPTGRGSLPPRARPITPDPAPALAGTTPQAASQLPARNAAVSRASAAAAQPAAQPCGAPVAQDPAALWPRIHSFVCCIEASPLVQSALASLLLGDPQEGRGDGGDNSQDSAASVSLIDDDLTAGPGLQLVLSQMLALFLRAGYSAASEETLLAALWLLESFHNSWRSPATVVISAYVRHLCLFSPELVHHLTQDWRASFRRLRSVLVDAQGDLLARLDWRVQLDMALDVRPCHLWLFQSASSWRQLAARLPTDAAPGAAPAPVAAPPAALGAAWATHTQGVCAHVARQAAMVAPPPGPVSTPRSDREPSPEFSRLALSTKRQRTQR